MQKLLKILLKQKYNLIALSIILLIPIIIFSIYIYTNPVKFYNTPVIGKYLEIRDNELKVKTLDKINQSLTSYYNDYKKLPVNIYELYQKEYIDDETYINSLTYELTYINSDLSNSFNDEHKYELHYK